MITVFKLRVLLDSEKDVFRDIEIRSTQTLWTLHNTIKNAFSLKGDEMASFYESDEDWSQNREIPLEEMSDDMETMADINIKEVVSTVGDKLLYVYDFMDMWTFYIDLIEISEKETSTSVQFPKITYRFGNAPLKAPKKPEKDFLLEDDLDDVLAIDGEDDEIGDMFNDLEIGDDDEF